MRKPILPRIIVITLGLLATVVNMPTIAGTLGGEPPDFSTVSSDNVLTVTAAGANTVTGTVGPTGGGGGQDQFQVVIPSTFEVTSISYSGTTGINALNLVGCGLTGTSTLNQTFTPAQSNCTLTYAISTDFATTALAWTVTINTVAVGGGDTTPPTLNTTPGNLTTNTDAGKATATVTYTAPTFTDNVSVTSVTQTAGLASGATTYPLGVTTNTFESKDAEGNTFAHSFTVTVSDNEAPQFTTVPSNINIDIDFGQTGAVVTYATPTATDNQPGVTVALISGLTSGATFPIGATVVTYEATDAANNKTQTSFTVTISVIPPGQVEIKVVSAEDGQFSFTSLQPEFTFNLASAGGSGTSGVIQIRPGTYAYSFTKPEGFGITGGSCSDSASVINITALTGSITLVSGQSITCTISVVNARGETTRQIGNFLHTRASLITQNSPNTGRRLERLTGKYTNNGGVSGFGLNFNNENIPFALRLSPTEGAFAFSLLKSQVQGNGIEKPASLANKKINSYEHGDSIGAAAFNSTKLVNANSAQDEQGNMTIDPMKHRYDLWVEGKVGKYDADNADGKFAIVNGGFDYLLTPKVLVGMGVQIDWLDQDEKNAGELSGTGFLIGPFVTARLHDNLYLDARVAWGKSDNDISPFGTYKDSFDSERWLASAALLGDFSYGTWRITPEVRLNYFEDESKAYVDSLNVEIPSVQSVVGELEFGSRIDYQISLDNKRLFSPYIILKGIRTFKNKSTVSNLVNATPNTNETGFRARTELGFSLVKQEEYRLTASAFYDGIDDNQFKAWGGGLELNIYY